MLEKEIEVYLTRIVKANKGMCIKLNSISLNGMPDRLIILPGNNIFFVELKAPGRKPRKLQRVMMNKLKSLGCEVYVIDNKEKARELIENYTSI